MKRTVMSLKIHFLHLHLDKFPENLEAVNEEQGERFHQDINTITTKGGQMTLLDLKEVQGHWNTSMLADYAWCLKRAQPVTLYNRKSGTRSFLSKRKRFH